MMGPLVDVTAPPYSADRTGVADATAAIQAALDDVGRAGGGVVFLPAGQYTISVQPGAAHALLMSWSNVVLRGEGAATMIVGATEFMRNRRLILIAPSPEYFSWAWEHGGATALVADAAPGATEVFVGDVGALRPDHEVVVAADATDAWIAERGMTGTWTPTDTDGPLHLRRIVRVDAERGAIELDVPLRHTFSTRDRARVVATRPSVHDVGVEDLSIGMVENRGSGWGDDDYGREGTGAFAVHDSFAIYFNHVSNAWVRRVASFRPTGNRSAHLASNGIRVEMSRNVSLLDLGLANPQYRGAGGNGYLVTLTGNEVLAARVVAEGGRHNFSFSFTHSSGNVLLDCTSRRARLPIDGHQRLSTANLIDRSTLDSDRIALEFRECCGHGHGATESVVWNVRGDRYDEDIFGSGVVAESQQYGHGYLIGSRGPASRMRVRGGNGTEPIDWLEGVGEGDTLEPSSLYLDQRSRRTGVAPPDPDPADAAVAPDAASPDASLADASRSDPMDAGHIARDAAGLADAPDRARPISPTCATSTPRSETGWRVLAAGLLVSCLCRRRSRRPAGGGTDAALEPHASAARHVALAPTFVVIALVLGACGATPSGPPPRSHEGDMHATPYSAEEIRVANPAGRWRVFSVSEAGGPPWRMRMRFTTTAEERATYDVVPVDDAGVPIGEPRSSHASWEELRLHASWPASRTTASDETIATPAGQLACRLYVIIDPSANGGATTTRAWFASDPRLAGPPVLMTVEQGGLERSRMELLATGMD